MSEIDKIVDRLSNLTIIESVELVKKIRKSMGSKAFFCKSKFQKR
jgi:ribosomal protein L7/L12